MKLPGVQLLQRRFQAWFESRLSRRDRLELTQRNVYILPTAPGFMLALTLLVLLVASINYQLNLGYLLTFMLTGCALVAIYVCHATLLGLTLHLVAPEAQFAGSAVPLDIHLHSTRRAVRHGIGLAVFGSGHWSWTDVPAQGNALVHVAFVPPHRGLVALPTLTAETRFPLGTFRVWTIWRPAAQVLVYPAPEAHAPPLPAGRERSGGGATARTSRSTEFDGVRPYRRGDALKQVVWKKVAKTDQLVSRDVPPAQRLELWLDLADCASGSTAVGSATLEHKLSRLCAWVLRCEQLGLRYGLRLGTLSLGPADGANHKRACLQALALDQPHG